MFTFAVPLFVGAFHHYCYCRLPYNVAASVIMGATVQVIAPTNAMLLVQRF